MLLFVLIFESALTFLASELHIVETVHFISTNFDKYQLFLTGGTRLLCLYPIIDASPAVNRFAILALDRIFHHHVANCADESLVKLLLPNHLVLTQLYVCLLFLVVPSDPLGY